MRGDSTGPSIKKKRLVYLPRGNREVQDRMTVKEKRTLTGI